MEIKILLVEILLIIYIQIFIMSNILVFEGYKEYIPILFFSTFEIILCIYDINIEKEKN